MPAPVYGYIEWIWAAVGVVWLIGTLVSKQTARREPTSSRLLHMAIMAAVFALPFSARLHVGPLAWRFVPDSPVIAWTGLALTAAGCAFAIWARLLPGGNWSSSVTVKQDHRLIRRGPYAIVRHPIYSGFLLGLLGTALALASIGWRMKSRREEAFMTAEFGAEYTRYQREVKALSPFVL